MENLQKAIGLFIEEMRDFVVSKLDPTGKGKWSDIYYNALSEQGRNQWDNQLRSGTDSKSKVLIDFGNLPDFAMKHREDLKKEFKSNANNLVTWFKELREVRNKLQHFDFSMTPEMAEKAFLTMIQILEAIGEKETADTLRMLRTKSTDKQESVPKETTNPNTKPQTSTPNLSMLPPWFSVVIPHLDIRKGRLDESVFAANLMEVSQGNGREVYANPSLFFEKTFPTVALKGLIQRVLEGLVGGDSENRVISLQTGFGGGKTHSLISLYHLARLPQTARKQKAILPFLASTSKSSIEYPQANVAVFTNTTNDPTQGRTCEDGTHIKTLWGEIAYQLGGKSLFDTIKDNDETRVSPKGLFKKVLEKAKPSLILIDELADYCLAASGVSVGASNLSDQTISFLQELTQAVAEVPGIVLVATLPASNVELGNSEASAKILTSLESRIKRIGADQKPVDDNEIYEVIRRRLFENFDEPNVQKLCEEICNSYKNLYFEHTSEIPNRVTKPEYTQLLKKSYPFHPELILAFQHKWGSHPGFQRTRGVLRILANIVADLWKRKESLMGSQAMIHDGDIRYENLNTLSSELRRLHGDGYEAVILADVSGANSHSYQIDSEISEYGNFNITKSIASSILLNSFGTDGANKGLNIKEIKLSLLRPDSFNHNLVNGSLNRLVGVSHYLYYSSDDTENKKYWFHTKPNINILITQARAQIPKNILNAEIIDRLKEKVSAFRSFRTLVNSESDEVPEQDSLSLIFLSPDYRGTPEELFKTSLTKINTVFQKRGKGDRMFRNTILFCLASESVYPRLINVVSDFVACKKTLDDYNFQLEKDQKEELTKKLDENSKKFDSTLKACYSIVVKPRSKADHFILSITDSSNESWEQQILTSLKQESLLIDSLGSKLLSDHGLMPNESSPVAISQIYQAFLRYDDKPMITGPNAILNTIQRLVSNREYSIASKSDDKFIKFQDGNIPTANDLNDESLVLVHPNLLEEGGEPSTTSSANIGIAEKPLDQTESGETLPDEPAIKSLEVSGNVAFLNYTYIFSSFIQQLKDNQIEIEIRIKGHSTESHPISKSSQKFKIIQESAKQLGLKLDIEE